VEDFTRSTVFGSFVLLSGARPTTRSVRTRIKPNLSSLHPKATYKVYEEMTKVTDGKEAIAYHEVMLVTADKKTFEVEVSPEGKILNIEEKKEEKKWISRRNPCNPPMSGRSS